GSHLCFLLLVLPIEWQGNKDSNLGMPESKSGALTDLAIPLHNLFVCRSLRFAAAEIVKRIRCYDCSKCASGCCGSALAFQAFHLAGMDASTVSACCSSMKGQNTHAPEPVILASPYCFSHSMASATGGNSFAATTCRSFFPKQKGASEKSDIVTGFVSRVKPVAENICCVGTPMPGSMTTYQQSGVATSINSSPTPSAKALRPNRKNGTSAPSCNPNAINSRRVRPACHR